MRFEAGHATVLITGAAQRIGAQIAETLHGAGMNVLLHCRSSVEQAAALADELNAARPDSAQVLRADLRSLVEIAQLAAAAVERWGRVDTLVNNASVFRPTAPGVPDEDEWNELIGVNLKAPLFLSRHLAGELCRRRGCIVNLSDIHAGRPLEDHTIYCVAKAGLEMLTRALARELAPDVRCNGVAPGAILWPRDDDDDQRHHAILERVALKRTGMPRDVASAVLFLVRDADYMTGQIITVDGGRSLQH